MFIITGILRFVNNINDLFVSFAFSLNHRPLHAILYREYHLEGFEMSNILFVGESWQVHVQETKGFDVFTYDYYETAVEYIQKALVGAGHTFTHIPAHMVEFSFPNTPEGLNSYDVVMFSDVGANTFNLPMNVFQRLKPTPNRLEAVRDYVSNGGAFVMIGGYLTFQGIQGRGCYRNSAIADILPVELLPGDDRIEASSGVKPVITLPDHPIVRDLSADWPMILGYNKLIPKAGATVVATINDAPMIVTGEYGNGRVIAYATDCAPHWSPVDFCEWSGYQVLWNNMIGWLTKSLQ